MRWRSSKALRIDQISATGQLWNASGRTAISPATTQ